MKIVNTFITNDKNVFMLLDSKENQQYQLWKIDISKLNNNREEVRT